MPPPHEHLGGAAPTTTAGAPTCGCARTLRRTAPGPAGLRRTSSSDAQDLGAARARDAAAGRASGGAGTNWLLIAALGCGSLALVRAALSQAHAKLALSSANLHLTAASRHEQEKDAEMERLELVHKLRDMNASFRQAQARRGAPTRRRASSSSANSPSCARRTRRALWAQKTLRQLGARRERQRETQRLTATARAAWHERNYMDKSHEQLEDDVVAELNRSHTALMRLRARLRHLRFDGVASD